MYKQEAISRLTIVFKMSNNKSHRIASDPDFLFPHVMVFTNSIFYNLSLKIKEEISTDMK